MRIFFLLLALHASFFASGQENAFTTGLLKTAWLDLDVNYQEKKLDIIRQETDKFPILDNLEFRTESNEFALDEQEYALRFGLNNKRQIKAQGRLKTNLYNNLLANQQIALIQALSERYEVLIAAWHLPKLVAAISSHKTLIEDKISLLKRSTGVSDFDINDLIEDEENLHEIERNLFQLENQYEAIQKQITLWNTEPVIIFPDSFPLVSIEQIRNEALSWQTDSLYHPLLDERLTEVEEAIQEQELELAEMKNPLDFIQLKYGGRNRETFNESFSIGLSLNLPVKGTNKLDLLELEVEKLDAEQKFRVLQTELIEDRQYYYDLLMESIETLDLIRNQLNNNQAGYAYEQYIQVQGASPMALLKMKESLIKKEILLIKYQQATYLNYIKFLEASGKILEAPLRDWLHPNRPTL